MMYDPTVVKQFYNDYGEKEWARLDASAHARLIFHLHQHFLADHIGSGKSVLDVGCGAGRFSLPIAQSGSELTLVDLSEEQLRLAKAKIVEHQLTDQVADYIVADICDLAMLGDNQFDTIVCYGAVLNYLFDRLDQAVTELRRLSKPNGMLIVSVASRWGVLRTTIANEKLDAAEFFGQPEKWKIYEVAQSGNLPSLPEVSHPARHFFTATELAQILAELGLEAVELACAPSLSSALSNRLEQLEQDEQAWQTVLNLEERAYRLPDLRDSGEFLMAKGRVKKKAR